MHAEIDCINQAIEKTGIKFLFEISSWKSKRYEELG
jgi:hypothetical protein